MRGQCTLRLNYNFTTSSNKCDNTKTLGNGPNGISRDLKRVVSHTYVYRFKEVNMSIHIVDITNNAKNMQL
jgi:hypothetical protein